MSDEFFQDILEQVLQLDNSKPYICPINVRGRVFAINQEICRLTQSGDLNKIEVLQLRELTRRIYNTVYFQINN